MPHRNPFEYKFPDQISSRDLIDLFVPVFGDYFSIPESGHTFIHGARGSGKSMMFRYMRPDCQILVDSDGKLLEQPRKFDDLDYLGLYVPIKKGNLDKTEIRIIENRHGEALLNEHYMVLFWSIKIFDELSTINIENSDDNVKELKEYYDNIFIDLLENSGFYDEKKIASSVSTTSHVFRQITQVLRKSQRSFEKDYIQKLIGAKETLPYHGPIFLYNDFLFEMLRELRQLSFFPNVPFFLLVDDADNLNLTQQKILNSWVAQRTTDVVSLKISTQLRYTTYRTINDSRIDTPHDYSVVNINDIYTTKKGLYLNRVKDMVYRRLRKFEFEVCEPESFFPEDEEQRKRLKAMFDAYEQKHGYDYAYRYTVPDFIKSLEGNRYTFSYSGFEQLVNISSGNMRDFINFASKMYVHQISSKADVNDIQRIEHNIQDRVIKEFSDNFLFSEFDELVKDTENDQGLLMKLRNLIHGLGGLFKFIMISDASERRVFSVAINDEPMGDLRDVLDLGVRYNYFHKALIGNKYGTGKSRLFVLNRMLAPHFILDPSGFAGYKFVDSAVLSAALIDPNKFIKTMKKSIKSENLTNGQQQLFND